MVRCGYNEGYVEALGIWVGRIWHRVRIKCSVRVVLHLKLG